MMQVWGVGFDVLYKPNEPPNILLKRVLNFFTVKILHSCSSNSCLSGGCCGLCVILKYNFLALTYSHMCLFAKSRQVFGIMDFFPVISEASEAVVFECIDIPFVFY